MPVVRMHMCFILKDSQYMKYLKDLFAGGYWATKGVFPLGKYLPKHFGVQKHLSSLMYVFKYINSMTLR